MTSLRMADTNNVQETLDSLGALNYKALQAQAKKRGIKANLSKAQLVQELLSASTQQHQVPCVLLWVDSVQCTPQILDTIYNAI